MSKPDIFIETAILATKDQLADRVLASGKIESKDESGAFLFYIFELLSPKNTAIQKIILSLRNSLKSSEAVTVDIFEKALSNINLTLGRLSETSDNLWIGKLNAVVGMIDQGELLIAQTGNVTGYIFRQNKISSLTDQPDSAALPQPSRTFADITSGTILVGDQIVFGNNELFNRVSVDRLRSTSKLGDVVTSATELKKYLRKTRVGAVNAVFIESTPELRQQDRDIVVYLDVAEETAFKSAGKKIAPVIERIKISAREIFRTSLANGNKLAERWHRSWLEKYQPQSKKLFQQGGQKIKQGLSSGRKKIVELNYGSNNPSRLKIKTNSYHKPAIKNFSLAPVWNKIYPALKHFFSKKNQRLIIAIIFILILVISYVKIKINNSNKSRAVHQVQVASAYDQASSLFTQAKKDLILGKTASLDKFYLALALAETAKEDKANIIKTTALIKKINTIVDEKTKTVRFYNSQNYAFASGANKVVLADNQIYGLNSDNKIYAVDTRDHKLKLVGSISAGDANVTDLYYSATINSILFTTTDKKLQSFDLAKSVVGALSNASPDGNWKGSTAIATYSTNIYSLDSDAGTVWKYTASDTGYSKATDYADTRRVSLKGAIDLSVDGNIYVLKQDGSAAKFVKGAYESDFTLRNIPAPQSTIGTPAKLFTDDTTNNIFVLDKKTSRVIKFDKSGEFNSQYVFDDVALDSFVVDAKLQKIWGLANGKIYEGNL